MLDLDSVTVRGVPVVPGVANGVLTYATGIVASFVLFLVTGLSLQGSLGFADLSVVSATGFSFYGGHLVPITWADGSMNFALEATDGGYLYLVLVALLLVSTGYSLGSRDGVRADGETAVLAGASLALGYLPLAVAGALFFTATQAETSVSLPLLGAVTFAGLLFPAGLGATGGYVASRR